MTDPEQDPRWAAVRAAGRHPVPTPPGLVDRVLRSLDGVRGRSVRFGGVTMTEPEFLRIAREAAETARVPGLHVSTVALVGGRLQLLATVQFGVLADEAADLLRERLAAALAGQLGVRPPAVDVHVIDVEAPPSE
ncbi:hypothetical protein [Amycolatopsis jejuensis]|uniref:hypothetical protein n=1 Tax=Amycolatopsis jejuensis TaxID=330084 RepID=UPI0005247BD7|nr:hypothetical protein [Amycolatopsis jejuensis]